MKTIIKSLLTKLLPEAKSQPPKANGQKPTAKGQEPTANPPIANGQKPTADPTVLLNLFLTLGSD